MVVFGHEVPDVMVVKIGAFAVLGLLVGLYEVRRARRVNQGSAAASSSESSSGEVKHMGMVDEVPPDQRLP